MRSHNLPPCTRCTHNALENKNSSEDRRKGVDKGEVGMRDESTPSSFNSSETAKGKTYAHPSSSPLTTLITPLYPQVLALPIAHCLFSSFCKAIVTALKGMMKRSQLYLGAFLFKDPNANADVITDLDHDHPPRTLTGGRGRYHGCLVPVRRIRIKELVNADDETEMDREETVEPLAIPTQPVTPPAETEGEKKVKEPTTFAPTCSYTSSPSQPIQGHPARPLFWRHQPDASNLFYEPTKSLTSQQQQELQDVFESLSVPEHLRK
ncbi:hypothetical protein BDQ17DRAFT_1438003 [Cyathus striatus]|nr:hypothetical protein BDQ17DRAFT_1438003 [Cyathus striatus]